MHIEKPYRVRHAYRQHLVGPPERVFPLLCPVREREWVNGWDPRLVVSASGFAERDCSFITSDGVHESVWIVTEHDAARFVVEFVKVTPHVTATRINIALEADGGGTIAEVAYQHTAIGPEGNAFVASFTEEMYMAFMKEWERSLNHYLSTGTMLVNE